MYIRGIRISDGRSRGRPVVGSSRFLSPDMDRSKLKVLETPSAILRR
jgi:hypothetical protein